MFPEYPQFKTLDLEDQLQLKKYFREHQPTTCEFSPTNLFIWKDFDRASAKIINDNLCILISPINEAPFFLEPLGKNKTDETIEACLKQTGKISRVSEKFISLKICKTCKCKCLRDHFDYVYLTKTMSELKGKDFDGKRNHINKFRRRFPDYKFEKLTVDHKNQAMELFEAWFAAKSKSPYFNKLAHEAQKNALERAFSAFDWLGLIGGALFAENTLKGFIVGSQLNNKTVSVHFEYADPHTQGTAQMLFFEAANKIFNKFEYMNLEQDLGIPGLRKAKLSYYPIKVERKYEISK